MFKLSRVLPFVVVALLALHTHTASAQKTYNWDNRAYEGCHLLIGKITFNPDGTGFWEATTYSDVSYLTMGIVISAKSSGGTTLYTLPSLSTPRMNAGNATAGHFPWTKSFVYDRSIYNDLHTADASYTCTRS